MFDTLTIARQSIVAGVDPDQANAITDAIRQAAEHGDDVTTETLDARLGALEPRLDRAMLLRAGAIVGAVVATLRLLG